MRRLLEQYGMWMGLIVLAGCQTGGASPNRAQPSNETASAESAPAAAERATEPEADSSLDPGESAVAPTGAQLADPHSESPDPDLATPASAHGVAEGTASPAENPGPGPVSAAGYGELSPEARAVFWGSPEDPPAEHLDATRPDLEGRHYLYSDELNLHLFLPHLEGLAGGYAGVGSDQAYLFMGAMRPNLVWLTDYDPWIKWLHLSYLALFDLSPDTETFLAHWDHETEEATIELLGEYYQNDPEREQILFVFDEANRAVHRRLRRLRAQMQGAGIATFINDEPTYQFVQMMVRNRRVRPMLANLLDEHAFVAIGEASRRLGVPLRALYLSNTEEYWAYSEQFRINMGSLYFDEASLILRADATKPENNDYRYQAQGGLNFQAWLQQPYVRGIRDIWDREAIEGPDHIPFSLLDEPPHNWRAD